MDFSNERYVRLYLRDTTGWKLLRWEGQCVWTLLYRKADRAGVISLGGLEPWQAAALHCDLPDDVARVGTRRCLERRWLVHDGDRLVFPRYLEANESAQSNALRLRESRARRNALTRNVSLPTRNVSPPTQNASLPTRVDTPSRAVPCRADPIRTEREELQDRARALVVNAGSQDEPETDRRRGSDFMWQATGRAWQGFDRELALIGAKPEAERVCALAAFRADPWAQANITRCNPTHMLRKWNHLKDGAPAEKRPAADTAEVRTWRARVEDSAAKLSELRKRRSELRTDHPDYLSLGYDLDRQIREETERLERRTRELHALTG